MKKAEIFEVQKRGRKKEGAAAQCIIPTTRIHRQKQGKNHSQTWKNIACKSHLSVAISPETNSPPMTEGRTSDYIHMYIHRTHPTRAKSPRPPKVEVKVQWVGAPGSRWMRPTNVHAHIKKLKESLLLGSEEEGTPLKRVSQ